MIVMFLVGYTNRTDHLPFFMRCESRFAGKERDAESGNDYFGARYYASTMGRFLSPDWSAKYEPVPYAKVDDPQTLNLYAYVLNNPLARMDADGHDWRDTVAALKSFIADTTLKVEVGFGLSKNIGAPIKFEATARVGIKVGSTSGDSRSQLITEHTSS